MKQLLLFLSLWIGISTQAAFISEKCLKPFEDSVTKATAGEAFKVSIPVECQSYKYEDLDESMHYRVAALLKARKQTIPLDAKLSKLMGALSLAPVLTAQERCEKLGKHTLAILLDLTEKTDQQTVCKELVNKYFKENSPQECIEEVNEAQTMMKTKCKSRPKY